MGNRFASGKIAISECDICGFRYKLKELKQLVIKTKNVNLPHAVTILLGYWTAEADDNGRVQYRPDIYQHDATILAALEAAQR